MTRVRRVRRQVLVLTVVVGTLLGFRFHGWSQDHLAAVTRSSNPTVTNCLSCHGPGYTRTPPRPEGRRYPSPAAMALAPDGSRLFVSCGGTGEIVVLDLGREEIAARWPVGEEPEGLWASPGGDLLYVALRGENRVAILETDAGREVGTVPVGRSPRGLAADPEGRTLVVANSGSDDISLLDTASRTERCRLAGGREPCAVAVTPDGRQAIVANRLAGLVAYPDPPESEVTVVDLRLGRVARRPVASSAHLSEGIATVPSGRAFVSLVRVRNLVPISQVSQGWVMTSTLGIVDPGEDRVRQFPLDEVNAYFADPSGVEADEAGGRVYVASGGGDCVTVIDLDRLEDLAERPAGRDDDSLADHLGISSEYVLGRIPVQANPRALRLDPGGGRLFVAERLASSICVIDTGSLEISRRITLSAEDDLDAVRRGEILFHSAAITFQGQFSCRSCHPDGHVDGLTYDFAIDGLGKNILDNRSLLGLAGTAPFKWNGKNRDLFEQCGPRFARVLTRSDPFSPEALDDLVTYILSLPPPPAPAAGGALTPAQARGKAIFEREWTNDGREIPLNNRCTTCHPEPLHTNRNLTAVGTRSPTDTVEEFDVPHLHGIADSAPYLHDGRARTLEEIWTVHSPDDTHGVANDLSKEQLNDLVEYLKAL